MIRSLQSAIVRADIIPGIAHAALDMSGTTLLPFSPNGLMIRSMIKTTLARYPVSSSIEIKKNKLNVHYAHGRYGYWQYMFRYQNADFELIGYDISNGDAVIESAISINFLTKKKQEKVNVNSRAKGGDEVFKETWKNISINKLIKLSDIENFDELEFSSY